MRTGLELYLRRISSLGEIASDKQGDRKEDIGLENLTRGNFTREKHGTGKTCI
jgi:hypothetical protein